MQSSEIIRTIQIEIRRVPKAPRRLRAQAFCFLCRENVELISIPQAAQICRTTQYEIYQLAEKGEIHRIHNSQGSIMVCRNSLKAAETNFRRTRTIILEPLDLCR